jgi:phosphoserine phosphatase RsbU/P
MPVLRNTIKILILDNSPEDVKLISKCLVENGFTIPLLISNDEKSFIEQLDKEKPDVILCDHIIPEFSSFKALDVARKKYHDIIFILVSGNVCEEFALELLKEGINDYVLKNRLLRLPHAIESAIIKSRYVEESQKLVMANIELIKANEIIEAKNKSVTQSIIFAERIQKLTFPKIDSFLKEFTEAFILNQPKDIVSGDFYWISNKNKRTMIAVADCTGHGVSGALLSMIGFNFLNEIVENENNFTYPTDILSLLDANIRKLLHQDTANGYQDGIDIAFVSIDKGMKKIDFSGCKRPLWIYRKKEKEIVEFKGEPYLIGGVDSRVTKTFKSQEISYKPGDIVYMFTDGYIDQFGGDDNRKLMKERFIETLLSFKHLGLFYQGQLLEQRLLKWRGDFEQTDDVLVVGIKLT